MSPRLQLFYAQNISGLIQRIRDQPKKFTEVQQLGGGENRARFIRFRQTC